MSFKLFLLSLHLICFEFTITAQEQLQAEYNISGRFYIDTTWANKIYLSYIPTFKDMYTMSSEMIIEDTEIDSLGYFSFETSYLPAEDKLYRIHISKKSDPPISLIIGGYDENHIFLIANRISNIHITNKSKETLFKEISFKGYQPNETLKQINQIASYIDSSYNNGSAVKREFVKKAIYEKLRYTADTCKHPLASLYSLHKSKFQSNVFINKQFYKDYLKKWNHEKSSYFEEFRKQLPLKKNKEMVNRLVIGIVTFSSGFFLSFILRRFRSGNENQIKLLSIQERKILSLIKKGKSNKEISNECNIGLSTVKSHVNSIYSKLNIKSRTEAIDLKI